MSEVLLRDKVDSHLTWLVQRTAALDGFHAGNARLVLNDFCDWFVRDEVASHLFEIARQRVSISPQEWHAQANREGHLPALPDEPTAALGFRFAVLRLIRREKVDLKYFVANHFPGAHLNECLMHWKRVMVHPFAADCRTVAALGRARLSAADEWVDVRPFLEAILDGPFRERAFGPRAWTDADDEADDAVEPEAAPAEVAPQAADAAAPDGVEAALAALRERVEALGPGASDLLLDVDALRLEASRPSPRLQRARARLRGLAQRAELRPACAALEAAWA